RNHRVLLVTKTVEEFRQVAAIAAAAGLAVVNGGLTHAPPPGLQLPQSPPPRRPAPSCPPTLNAPPAPPRAPAHRAPPPLLPPCPSPPDARPPGLPRRTAHVLARRAARPAAR